MNRTKSIIRGLLIAGLMSLGTGIVNKAHAVATDTLALKVTVNVNASVDITTTTYSFGLLAANETSISTGAIPVLNNTGGITEDLQINGSDSANWTAHASTNTTTDNFNLRVIISTSSGYAPSYGQFPVSSSITNSAPQDLTNGNFGLLANGSGDNVPVNNFRYLWFRFIAPAFINNGNNVEQSVTVTVTAGNGLY